MLFKGGGMEEINQIKQENIELKKQLQILRIRIIKILKTWMCCTTKAEKKHNFKRP